MIVSYKVYSHAPDGINCLALFSDLSNARCFMYAWANVKKPDTYPDKTMSVRDCDGWQCMIVPADDDPYGATDVIVMDHDTWEHKF